MSGPADYLISFGILLLIPGVIWLVRIFGDAQDRFYFSNIPYVQFHFREMANAGGPMYDKPGSIERYQDAVECWAHGQTDNALDVLRALRAEFPVCPAILVLEASWLAAMEQHQAAAQIYEFMFTLRTLNKFAAVVLMSEYLAALFRSGDHQKLIQRCDSLLQSRPPARAVIPLDQVLTLILTHSVKELIPHADRWSEFNCRMVPKSWTLRGTRSAVLYEIGKKKEAEALLQEVLAGSAADIDRGFSSLYLGMIRAEQGNPQEAQKLWLGARLYHPQPWMIERVRVLLRQYSLGRASASPTATSISSAKHS